MATGVGVSTLSCTLDRGRFTTISRADRGTETTTSVNFESLGGATKAIPIRDDAPTKSSMGLTLPLLLLKLLPEVSALGLVVLLLELALSGLLATSELF